jgi:hypothetical protein
MVFAVAPRLCPRCLDLMDNGIFGVGGSEKNPSVRIQPLEAIGQFLAAHMGHDHVGKQQIDMSDAALVLQAHGVDAVGSRQNRVAQPFQQGARHLAQGGIVLDQQNGLGAAR